MTRDVSARLERMRARMAEEGIVQFYCRDLSNVKWLTGFEGVFDDEPAHLVLVTANDAVLHTDSRYADAAERAAAGTPWRVEARKSHAAWTAEFVDAQGAGRMGIETSMTLGEYRALEAAFAEAPQAPEQVVLDLLDHLGVRFLGQVLAAGVHGEGRAPLAHV